MSTLALAGPVNREQRNQLQSVITRLQQGQDEALREFIELTRETGYRLAYSYLRDRHRAEDALQDAYLVVYRKIGSLRNPEAVHTWFCRIVSNRCKRILEKRKTHEELSEENAPLDSTLEDRVSERLSLRRVFQNLRAIDRSILNLREVIGFSYDEIAATLNIPLGTVRSRLSKARKRLHQALTQEAASADDSKKGPQDDH